MAKVWKILRKLKKNNNIRRHEICSYPGTLITIAQETNFERIALKTPRTPGAEILATSLQNIKLYTSSGSCDHSFAGGESLYKDFTRREQERLDPI